MDSFEIKGLVSVGIPTYNRPEGLRRALECITGQTYKKLEIIVSDNCSDKPEVNTVLEEFANKDSRIQVFKQQKNNGAAFNFKFVFDNSCGDYFMWAADDDYWEPEFIETMVNLLDNNPGAVMSFCSFKLNDNQKIFDYQKYKNLSSSSLDKRLTCYLQIPDEVTGKASMFYSLYKRQHLALVVADTFFYWDMKNYASDNFFILNMLTRGSMQLSSQALYTVTFDNVKHYEVQTNKKSFFITIFLIIIKYFKIINMIFRYYRQVMKTVAKSGASFTCRTYWFVRYPFYIIGLMLKTTKRLLLENKFWNKYF